MISVSPDSQGAVSPSPPHGAEAVRQPAGPRPIGEILAEVLAGYRIAESASTARAPNPGTNLLRPRLS